jgi:SAM-dependent methyltransferase
MVNNEQILLLNKKNYQDLYSKQQAFLRYPADWIIRFHNMYLRDHLPSGRVLDYGCGGGNNSIFFIEKGFETYGVDVAESFIDLIKQNLASKHLDIGLADRFSLISPDSTLLPYPDNYFDIAISNQVLYYLPSEEHIRSVCADISRCLRPGGVVFFTMMGPRNYYITHHTKQIYNRRIYDIAIDDINHRLYGVRELIFLVRDEHDLCDLFSEFQVISTGYFDQKMFDMQSNYHWIFIGKKPD